MLFKKVSTGLLISILGLTQLKAQTLKPFKNGDKIAFVGNSITEAGYYGSNIWLYYMTRFPDQKITVLNAGIGGDVVGQINARFEDDVLPKKPNIVVITFGMNDTGYFEYNEAGAEEFAKKKVAKSYSDYLLLEAKLKSQPNITPIIMSSSPYDETMKNKNNYYKNKSKAMEQIVAFQQAAANKNGWAYVDLFHPMTAINLREQKAKPEFTITGPDRIHPGRGGHLVMAATFLKNQGLAGKPVAKIDIDAKSKTIAAENAKVGFVKNASKDLSFNYLANALPFPIDSVSGVWENPQTQADALAVYPFIAEFNQEILKVTSLPKGNYNLVIDGVKIKTLTADSLAKGVNMALMSNTPQYQQATSIMYLNDLRLELEKKLREYYWLQFNYFNGQNLLFADTQLAFDKVQNEAKTNWFVKSKMGTYQTARFKEVREMWQHNINELTDRIYKTNQPKSHLIQIVAL